MYLTYDNLTFISTHDSEQLTRSQCRLLPAQYTARYNSFLQHSDAIGASGPDRKLAPKREPAFNFLGPRIAKIVPLRIQIRKAIPALRLILSEPTILLALGCQLPQGSFRAGGGRSSKDGAFDDAVKGSY